MCSTEPGLFIYLLLYVEQSNRPDPEGHQGHHRGHQHIPIDQQVWKEAAELMRALNRLMYGEKARMDHMASNLRVETTVQRTVRSFRRKASMNIAS